MILVIIILCLLVGLIGHYVDNKYNDGRGEIECVTWSISIIGITTCIMFGAYALNCVVEGRYIEDKLSTYQEQNKKIEFGEMR